MIIDRLYDRLNYLVPAPDCDTLGDEYDNIIWRDARPQPTAEELEALDIDLIMAKVNKIQELSDYCAANEDYEISFVCTVDGVGYTAILREHYITKIGQFDGKSKNMNIKFRNNSDNSPARFPLRVPSDTAADLLDRDMDNFEFEDGHTDAINALTSVEDVESYDYTKPITVLGIEYTMHPADTASEIDVTSWIQ